MATAAAAAAASGIIKADVLIFGAGPGGLSTAQALARQLYTAIVFSDHTSPSGAGFRNRLTKHMHNVPGWDHMDPAEFRAKARADLLARYHTVEFRDVGIQSVRQLASAPAPSAVILEADEEAEDAKGRNGAVDLAVDASTGSRGGVVQEEEQQQQHGKMRFEAVDANGVTYQSRRLVVASGIRDVMPEEEIPGYTKLWGRTIYHCLFCHGFEERGHPSSAVLATGMLAGPHGAGVARMAARLASTVNVYTNGDEAVGEQLRAELRDTTRFHVINDKIVRVDKDPNVEGDAGLLVTLAGGKVNKEGFMAHMPNAELNGPFVKDLGLKLTSGGWIDTGDPAMPIPQTSVPGVMAVGDCATMMKAVPTATYMGACAAAGIAHDITNEDDVAK
ncbi:uncharacterized protein B0I36DRAFT_384196 [Microdochium trichocladiopsis]|uniref:FAD/NAD(P)-binding domain-containing protein n=1 Tax=Microdochium trichocladiopsis TaxID=1682393 RepID=A0A9P9BNM9_9PEZI|nr:uncharacterized protein B0I36DRAFT_384196 [Microdochium trichocladiopsis]KAH7031411.1 hypothetical protein B0I36DRAFT_384196 [Microdochium trichocladiopsis]